jgi:uncharacterized membrane protein
MMLQQLLPRLLLLVDMRRFRCFSLNRVLSAGSMRIRLDRLFFLSDQGAWSISPLHNFPDSRESLYNK